jgi:hypothetical protein
MTWSTSILSAAAAPTPHTRSSPPVQHCLFIEVLHVDVCPFSTSSRTTASFPCPVAHCSAVPPNLLFSLMCAPFSSSIRTTVSSPEQDAQCSGAPPPLSFSIGWRLFLQRLAWWPSGHKQPRHGRSNFHCCLRPCCRAPPSYRVKWGTVYPHYRLLVTTVLVMDKTSRGPR